MATCNTRNLQPHLREKYIISPKKVIERLERYGRFAVWWAFALENNRAKPMTYRVLIVISSYANNEGMAHPSQDTIARIAGIDERTVRRHLRILKKADIITATPRNRKLRETDCYRLKFAMPSELRCYIGMDDIVTGPKADQVTFL